MRNLKIVIGLVLSLAMAMVASAQDVRKEQTPKIPPHELVLVEGGSFLMGSPDGEGEVWERPQHKVHVTSFKISKYEITCTQFAQFLNDGDNAQYYRSNMDVRKVGNTYQAWPGRENRPMTEISWHEADAFAKWAGGRLPTEAEWEYAARGGNKSKGYKYSGSNDQFEVSHVNYCNHNIGMYKANELGIYDMSGNVWEWCSDWFGDYTADEQFDPKGPSSGNHRVRRGGSWGGSRLGVPVYQRRSFGPSDYSPSLGFRVVFP